MRIFQFAERHPERALAVTDAGETLRYGEILEAETLFRREVGNNLVFLLCRNTPGALLTYLGALKSAAIPLLLDAAMPAELLRGILDRYRPAFLVAPAGMETGFCSCGAVRDYALLRTEWEGPPLADKLKLLLTTSGSTGSPKLVRLSAENLDSNADAIAEYLNIDDAERPITSLPMQYSYGMSVVNSHVLKGATLLLTERTLLERDFWEFAVKERATSFAGVPYAYEMMDRLRLTELIPPSMQTLTQAGGKLSPELHRKMAQWCRDTERRFFVMYGQTEASPRMAYLPPERSLEKCGSMGIAIPGGALSLVDEDGNKITRSGETGELVYEGKNVCLGYAETREDLLRSDDNQGVLKTGDMAYRDDEGNFYIAGRKKRFIKILGKRVSLDEVETSLKKRFQEELVCAGGDDCLRVYIERERENDTADIENYIVDRIGIPSKYLSLISLKQFPRTASGKIRYRELPSRPASE